MRLTDETPFVAIPNFLQLDKSKIQYLDTLIYTALKSFDNPYEGCFPRHETIAARAGMSKRFVINSIKRLEASKLITVQRSDKRRVSNQYQFTKLEHFEQIPYDLFTATGLTANEKALLVCLRQFFVHGVLTYIDDISIIVKWLGLSYATIKPLYNSLIEKGYIQEQFKIYRKSKCNSTIKRLTDKISWLKMSCITSTLAKFNKPVMPKLKVA